MAGVTVATAAAKSVGTGRASSVAGKEASPVAMVSTDELDPVPVVEGGAETGGLMIRLGCRSGTGPAGGPIRAAAAPPATSS